MTEEPQANFFDPLWKRVLTLAFCIGWCAMEWIAYNQPWAWLTLGLVAYAIWSLFISYKPASAVSSEPEATSDDGN